MRSPVVIACLALATVAASQTAPIRSELRVMARDSGAFDNATQVTAVAWQDVLHVPGAPWMRLKIDAASLPAGSFLEVTSALDGHNQLIDAEELRVWNGTSAYFNGDMLFVRLVAAPRTAGTRIAMSRIEIGQDTPRVAPLTQCGPADDRVLSTDKRTGRLVPDGCTGWLISSTNCFVTAGHCCAANLTTVEFNVPLSSSTGTIVHPGPQDQYAIDTSTYVFENGGVGRDYCLFRSMRNGTTGRHAGEVQGEWFVVTTNIPVPAHTLRITGYGVDTDTRNRSQVNQTHSGPQATNSVATALGYQVDTTGGNSGSPVIDEATGRAIGVHTHGGCSTSGTGYNSGTSVAYAPFLAALRNATCGGAVSAAYTTFGAGCAGSNGVDTLTAVGVPRIGTSFRVNLAGGAASSIAIQFLGGSNSTWGALPLPVPIPGAPGCSLLVSGDLLSVFSTSAAGAGGVTYNLPNDAALLGGVFFNQNLCVDNGAAGGLTASNGGRGTIGGL